MYHSVYDTFKWYTRFSDGDFTYGRTLAQLTGTAVLRLADASVLPFQFSDMTDTLVRYVVEWRSCTRARRTRRPSTSRR